MAVTIRSQNTAGSGSANNSTLQFTAPAGIQVGDLLIACISWRSTTNPTPPSGWTQQVASKPGMGSWVFTKIADSTDAAAGTFSFTGSSARNGGTMYAVYGHSPSNYVSSTGTSGSTATGAGQNTVSDGGVWIQRGGMVFMSELVQGNSTMTESCASSFTVTEDGELNQSSGSFGSCHAVWNGGAAGDGTYGYSEITMTNTTNQSRAASAIGINADTADADSTSTVTLVAGSWAYGNATLPTGSQAGDLCICAAYKFDTGRKIPTGFTAIDGTSFVSWKILTSTDISNGSVSGVSSGSCTLVTLRGADNVTPIDIFAYNQGSTSGSDILVTSSAGTPTKAKGYHLVLLSYDNGNTSGGGGPNLAFNNVAEDNSVARRYSQIVVGNGGNISNWSGGAAYGVQNGMTAAVGAVYVKLASSGVTSGASGPPEFTFLSVMPQQVRANASGLLKLIA